MNCYYCDRILASDATYPVAPASFDLGSEAPRCVKHWRWVCGQCGKPAHFMACAYCPHEEKFFCAGCATSKEEVAGLFWAWKYHFRYRSPWSDNWCVSLDRLEF